MQLLQTWRNHRTESCCNKSKNSVANFKIREGMPIGCKVTLRGEKMYEFADRLINLALPRVRDFRGVNPTLSMAEETTHWESKNS